MKLYVNPHRQDHITNCAAFETFMRRFEWAKFFQPNAEKAPWHVQCVLNTEVGYNLTLNFWPHKLKGQFQGEESGGTFEGYEGLREMMALAIDECQEAREPFDVIEDSE